MTRTAAIIGGGIGGLAIAIGLHRSGWQATVFERSTGLPSTGTGLGIWPAALRAMDELGVGAAARAAGRSQASGAIRRPDGSPIATIDVARIQRREGEPVHLISRPALLRLLADAVPADTIQFGRSVADVAELTHEFDLVVGADGIRSATRTSLFGPRYALRYTGSTTWRGVVDLEISAGGETWGRGTKFGITPQEHGRTNWYAVLTVPEGYRPRGTDIAELREHFGGWHDPIPAILDQYDEGEVLRHDLHYLDPPLPSYVHGNVALIGDAAHAMTPDLGQGACQTLIDAAALSRHLATADVTDGLRAYDDERRRPSQRIAAMAQRASRLSQMRRFLPLRNAALKLAMAFGPPA